MHIFDVKLKLMGVLVNIHSENKVSISWRRLPLLIVGVSWLTGDGVPCVHLEETDFHVLILWCEEKKKAVWVQSMKIATPLSQLVWFAARISSDCFCLYWSVIGKNIQREVAKRKINGEWNPLVCKLCFSWAHEIISSVQFYVRQSGEPPPNFGCEGQTF